MTREKSTDRAEARRRYRVEGATNPPGVAPNQVRRTASPEPARRVGILEAFRLASGPADLRGDLAAFPSIVTGTSAVWLPSLVTIVTGVAYLLPDLRSNTIVAFLVQALLAPPAMIPSFLAGFLTRRGAWLVGGIAGLLSAVMAILIFAVVPGTATVAAAASDYALILLIGPLFGASVGAFAGFYRRFLALSSPNRGAGRKRPAKRR